jgi:hypothetical protein
VIRAEVASREPEIEAESKEAEEAERSLREAEPEAVRLVVWIESAMS